MALAKVTQDHEEIQKWADARGAKPAVVGATEGNETTGILRLMFSGAPNANDDALEEIEWDEWFEKFDDSGLEFHYQEKTADGKQSNFSKLTYPEAAAKKQPGKSAAKKTAAKKTVAKKTGAKKSAPKKASKKAAKSARR